MVVVTIHSPHCADCARAVAELGAVADRVEEWGGRILVVVPGEAGEEDEPGAVGLIPSSSGTVEILADPRGQLATDDNARVAVADEWGEIYFATDPGPAHEFPAPEEVVEWVRFIAIQCPECEGPEGAWRTLSR